MSELASNKEIQSVSQSYQASKKEIIQMKSSSGSLDLQSDSTVVQNVTEQQSLKESEATASFKSQMTIDHKDSSTTKTTQSSSKTEMSSMSSQKTTKSVQSSKSIQGIQITQQITGHIGNITASQPEGCGDASVTTSD